MSNNVDKHDCNIKQIVNVPLIKTNGPSSLFVQPQLQNEDQLILQNSNYSYDEEFTCLNSEQSSDVEDLPLKEEGTHPDMKSRLPLGIEISAGPGSVRKKTKDGAVKTKSYRPSDTLLFSASYIKSIFSTQNKRPDEKQSSDSDESVKNKMMMMWHSMKYGWSTGLKTSFSKETPIYLLGKIYHSNFEDSDASFSNLDGFKRDFYSILWFTYRSKFPSLPESGLTSDCGWGCMIRSGQMILAAALQRHFLPVGWFYEQDSLKPADLIHLRLVKWFLDSPCIEHPFSLHNLISYGHKINKKAGSWFGPSCVAHLIKEALIASTSNIPSLERMCIYVAQDGAVYVQDVLDLCDMNICLCTRRKENFKYTNGQQHTTVNRTRSSKEFSSEFITDQHLNEKSSLSSSWEKLSTSSEGNYFIELPTFSDGQIPTDYFVTNNYAYYNKSKHAFGDAMSSRLMESDSVQEEEGVSCTSCKNCKGWRSCLILIPVRLGASTINPIYHSCVYSLFLHDLCIGIIGGKPKHSLYFVGFQDDSLIYLDPHLTQDYVSPETLNSNSSSYHCRSPRKLPISKMDPSATIGFYCHTREQFFRLIEEAPMFSAAQEGKLNSPMFEFVDGRNHQLNGFLNGDNIT